MTRINTNISERHYQVIAEHKLFGNDCSDSASMNLWCCGEDDFAIEIDCWGAGDEDVAASIMIFEGTMKHALAVWANLRWQNLCGDNIVGCNKDTGQWETLEG